MSKIRNGIGLIRAGGRTKLIKRNGIKRRAQGSRHGAMLSRQPFDQLRTGGQIAAGERYMSQQMAALNRYVKEIV
jgi:hypothetical protein